MVRSFRCPPAHPCGSDRLIEPGFPPMSRAPSAASVGIRRAQRAVLTAMSEVALAEQLRLVLARQGAQNFGMHWCSSVRALAAERPVDATGHSTARRKGGGDQPGSADA